METGRQSCYHAPRHEFPPSGRSRRGRQRPEASRPGLGWRRPHAPPPPARLHRACARVGHPQHRPPAPLPRVRDGPARPRRQRSRRGLQRHRVLRRHLGRGGSARPASVRARRALHGRPQRHVLHVEAGRSCAEAGHRGHRAGDQQAGGAAFGRPARAGHVGEHRAGGPASVPGQRRIPASTTTGGLPRRACDSAPTGPWCGSGIRA